MRKLKPEELLCLEVSHHLKLCYPSLEYRFDYGAGATLFFSQAEFQKKIQRRRAWPDLTIYEPAMRFESMSGASVTKFYHGMVVELKAEGTRLTKKNGEWASEHIKEQAEQLARLEQKGYYACFAVGRDEALRLITKYLSWTKCPKKRDIKWN